MTLRGAILTQYTIELLNLKRVGLYINENDIKEQYSIIIKRFKKFINIALYKLTIKKYIIYNARIYRELTIYI